ncbi:MAG: SGNH/GDSL hydrolase family protein [bacterium]|nr:SGNH/GDSL hydrolase family protein [bacterium]
MSKNFLQVVLFGDSMSWSPGVAMGERYADFIEEKLSNKFGENWIVDVAACGDGGNTAQEGFGRLERDCISYQPHIVVLSFGANDSIRAPDREQFKTFYRKIINEIKQNATKHIILETIPTLDQNRHSQKDNPKALFYGGLENYLEFFSHSFIREVAKNEDLILYDRFKIYHQEIEKNPSLREKLIQKDGVHLTKEGNEFFAQHLIKLIIEMAPQIYQISHNPQVWLENAKLNPVYIECCNQIEKGDLKQYLSEAPSLKRLMLQKARSFSKRARALSNEKYVQDKALNIEYLASIFATIEKIVNTEDPEIKEKSKEWAISYLKQLPENRNLQKLKIKNLLNF